MTLTDERLADHPDDEEEDDQDEEEQEEEEEEDDDDDDTTCVRCGDHGHAASMVRRVHGRVYCMPCIGQVCVDFIAATPDTSRHKPTRATPGVPHIRATCDSRNCWELRHRYRRGPYEGTGFMVVASVETHRSALSTARLPAAPCVGELCELCYFAKHTGTCAVAAFAVAALALGKGAMSPGTVGRGAHTVAMSSRLSHSLRLRLHWVWGNQGNPDGRASATPARPLCIATPSHAHLMGRYKQYSSAQATIMLFQGG